MSERHRQAWMVGTVLLLLLAMGITWVYLDRAAALLNH
jgi:hypothetical protein